MSARSRFWNLRRKPRGSLLAVVLCALLACAAQSTRAQQEPVPSAMTQLAGDIQLARLVDLVSRQLGLNIEYVESDLNRTITLRLGSGVSDDELWALTNRLLASNQVTTIRMPGEKL